MKKSPKMELPPAATLFDMSAAPDQAEQTEKRQEIAGILLGTSSFTAKGWEGVFYPRGLQSRDFLAYYAKKLRAVEIDSTFYGTPKASTVKNWKERTPDDFVFALKIPQVITHEKILVGCDAEFEEFLGTMSALGEKLGPMLFQFPKFDKWTLKSQEEFLKRLDALLVRVANPAFRFAVEIRNKEWLDASLVEFLRERRVALALTDTTWVPRPWELPVDLITADFAYVRWLGDRKGIEKITTEWNKTVVDRAAEMKKWVSLSRALVQERKLRHVFLFANNHYSGFAPGTIELFQRLWKESEPRS